MIFLSGRWTSSRGIGDLGSVDRRIIRSGVEADCFYLVANSHQYIVNGRKQEYL